MCTQSATPHIQCTFVCMRAYSVVCIPYVRTYNIPRWHDDVIATSQKTKKIFRIDFFRDSIVGFRITLFYSSYPIIWDFPSDTILPFLPRLALTSAILQSLLSRIEFFLQGRRGLGSIYVWAVGNGRSNGDSCATDGYASSIYTIAVGAVNQWGQRAYYDEACSARMGVTFNHNRDSRTRTNTQAVRRSYITSLGPTIF